GGPGEQRVGGIERSVEVVEKPPARAEARAAEFLAAVLAGQDVVNAGDAAFEEGVDSQVVLLAPSFPEQRGAAEFEGAEDRVVAERFGLQVAAHASET